MATQVALNNEHMDCVTFDLPPVEPIAKENINMMGLTGRVTAQSGDFLTQDLPKADIITMGNILHDWGVVDKKGIWRTTNRRCPSRH